MALPNVIGDTGPASAAAGGLLPRDIEYWDDFIAGGVIGKFSTTDNAAQWLTTNVTGTGVYTISDAERGGTWRIDTGAVTDNHGCNCQMPGEAWAITANRDIYFEIRMKTVASIEAIDWAVGLASSDISVLAGVADFVGFRSGAVGAVPLNAGTADILATTGDDMAADWTSATAITEADTGYDWVLDTFRTLAFKISGTSQIDFYVDTVNVLSTTTDIPDADTALTLTIAIQNNGGVTREVVEVDYIYCAQAR